MHKTAEGKSREDIVKQVKYKYLSLKTYLSVKDYANYIPIGRAVNKLQKWKILECPEMITESKSGLPPLSSPWLGMNLLMINQTVAMVDELQKPLIKLLENHGIDVLPVRLRHSRVLGGGVHCTTLDVTRIGKMENYFD